jgi:hypothetical protein
MKIGPLILLLAIAISPASAMDPRQRIDEAVRTGDDPQVDQAAAAWTAAEPPQFQGLHTCLLPSEGIK